MRLTLHCCVQTTRSMHRCCMAISNSRSLRTKATSAMKLLQVGGAFATLSMSNNTNNRRGSLNCALHRRRGLLCDARVGAA